MRTEEQNAILFYTGLGLIFLGSDISGSWYGVGIATLILGLFFVVTSFIPDKKNSKES